MRPPSLERQDLVLKSSPASRKPMAYSLSPSVVPQVEDIFVVFLFLAVRIRPRVGAFPDRHDEVLAEGVGRHHEPLVGGIDQLLDALFGRVADRADSRVDLAALAGIVQVDAADNAALVPDGE